MWVEESPLAIRKVPVHIGGLLATRAWVQPSSDPDEPPQRRAVIPHLGDAAGVVPPPARSCP
jgi:hypothetical protein